jgi:hydroxymethylbilane synthase
MTEALIRIGTRGSPLALVQSEWVRRGLAAAWPELAAPDAVAIVPIRTSGDRIQDKPLADAGGKGLFTKEIEEALRDGRVDIAVHSLKDMETRIPDGLVIDCVPQREDPRDVLVAAGGAARPRAIAELPQGAVVGTSALRRKAQLLALRPDLKIVDWRGNVDTRIKRLEHGASEGAGASQGAVATLLALAGLKRLGHDVSGWAVLEPSEMLPAVAQGALGVERRADDARVARLLAPLHDRAAGLAVTAERALLATLDGSCRTPIAALATIDGERLALDALVATPDGSRVLRTAREGAAADAAALGRDAGAELKARAGRDFFATA